MTATFVDITDDTLQAFGLVWDASAPLVAAAGHLQAGDVASQPDVFAKIECVKGKANERMTGGAYHDYRNVTITIRGTKTDVTAAMALALAVVNRTMTLTMPSGARFIQFWPDGDGEIAKDEGLRRKGEEIWLGTIKGQVWTVRTDE